jgi:recombination protein RecA
MAEFDIMYGKGISREGSLLDVGIDLGIVKKSGAWFTYEGEQLGQGREKAKQFLTENLDLMFEISEKVKQAVGLEDASTESEENKENSEAGTTNGDGQKNNGRASKGKRADDSAETLEIDS